MFRFTAQRVIRRPLEDVFAYLADVTRQTEWVHGVTACQWLGSGGVSVGAVAHQDMTFIGKSRTVALKVVDYVPQRRIVFEKQEPFPIRFGFEVERHGDATKVQYPVEMQPKGLFRIVLPLVGRRTITGISRASQNTSRQPKVAAQPTRLIGLPVAAA